MPRRKSRKKEGVTPRSIVRHAVRKIWLQSRERRYALKRDHYTCTACERKLSKAKDRDPETTVDKLQVHHLDGISWEQVIDIIIAKVLQTPDRLVTLCPDCHDKIDETFEPKKIQAKKGQQELML